jgi:hypothetical protein
MFEIIILLISGMGKFFFDKLCRVEKPFWIANVKPSKNQLF